MKVRFLKSGMSFGYGHNEGGIAEFEGEDLKTLMELGLVEPISESSVEKGEKAVSKNHAKAEKR